MKQSKTKININNHTAAIYLRISREDNLEGESGSISNQKKILTKAAKEKGYNKLLYFVDDGISGTSITNRTGLQNMLAEIEKGYIQAVFVKDMSRLGRNYLEVGKLTDEFFPLHDVFLIALSDGIDTSQGEDEFTPFRNIMNEWYARDISKKRKMANLAKSTSGLPLSLPPYGYKKCDDSQKWVIDEEAANVVRRIFNQFLSGRGTEQIAKDLSDDKILNPMCYWLSKGLNRGGTKNENPTYWGSSTISKILKLQEYCRRHHQF